MHKFVDVNKGYKNVGTHAGVIHLNGQSYDAKTGRPITPHKTAQKPTARSAQSVDGFFVAGAAHPRQHTATVKAPKTTQHTAKQPPRSGAKHTVRHKQQRSKTLMRGVVSRPSFPVVAEETPAQPVATKAPVAHTERMKRALAVKKSTHISKFGGAHHRSHIEKKVVALPVQPAPQKQPANHHKTIVKTTTTHATSPRQSAAETHFSKAMSKADAHTHHARKTKKHRVARHLGMSARVLNAAAGALAIIMLAGFFAYQNIPNISMRIAASRAGFSAQLPEYQPSGFALGGPITYGPGMITVSFSSNSDDRHFNIKQQVSNWNSEALADNFLASSGKTYQAYQDKGRTIYLYDNANATWVNGGIWYQVDGNGVLSNEQLIRVANSF